MADRGLDVLEKYDFQVRGTMRGRGFLIVDTDKGPRLLKYYIGSGKHLNFCGNILEKLNESGIILVDAYEKNREGEYITESADGGRYVIKRWFANRECDTKMQGDILGAVRNLAFLHNELRRIEAPCDYKEKKLLEEYTRKNIELKRIKKYLIKKLDKNSFESLATTSFNSFLIEMAESIEAVKKYEEHEPVKYLMHGNFNQHNIYFGEQLGIICNFEKMCYGYQLKDLYSFMRKILEKSNWDIKTGYAMINEYSRIRPVSEEDIRLVAILFSFPEKYWKLMNGYFNCKKTFLSSKNIEKLQRVIEQNEERLKFIKTIH